MNWSTVRDNKVQWRIYAEICATGVIFPSEFIILSLSLVIWFCLTVHHISTMTFDSISILDNWQTHSILDYISHHPNPCPRMAQCSPEALKYRVGENLTWDLLLLLEPLQSDVEEQKSTSCFWLAASCTFPLYYQIL